MPDRLTDQIAQLVETWRKPMLGHEMGIAQYVFRQQQRERCADELAALLATHQEPEIAPGVKESQMAEVSDEVREWLAARLRHTGAL